MSIYYCQRCETSIDVPEELSLQDKNEIARLAKRAMMQAIGLVSRKSHLQPGEAKALTSHLTGQDRICHRCVIKQTEQEVTVCPKCKALNLNWAD
jgi:hypothetical protein